MTLHLEDSHSSDLVIGVVGLGHVGLPTALCLAELGWKVVGTDHDRSKVEMIKGGHCPIYEKGVPELLTKHLGSGRFLPEADVEQAIRASDVLFICVGTPQRDNGEADVSQIEAVARTIARNLNGYKLIVEKSTVPIKTAQWIKKTLLRYRNGEHAFDVASNPEFLRQGTAVQDFLKPDRIVLGVESERARRLLVKIYEPLLRQMGSNGAHPDPSQHPRLVVTDINSAEIIKHASNAFLATKISFINMIADLCEATGADITEVARGMGLDPRIGPSFLRSGIGYGGYCLPKDIRALIHIGEEEGLAFPILHAADVINVERIDRFVERVRTALWVIEGKTIGVLGLAFKADTDDIRDAPSLAVVDRLLAKGAHLRLHDPQAMGNVRHALAAEAGRVTYCGSAYEAAEGTHALLLLTEWEEYKNLDLARIREVMQVPMLIDGRNLYDPIAARALGFDYRSIGRPYVEPLKR